MMSHPVISVSKSAKVQEVEKLFQTNNIHHLLVLEGSKLVGVISKSDYLFFRRGFHDVDTDKRMDLFRLKKWTAEQIMTTGIATLEPSDKINVALEVFNENLFHAIPIVEEGKAVGILTTYDVIYHLSKSNKILA